MPIKIDLHCFDVSILLLAVELFQVIVSSVHGTVSQKVDKPPIGLCSDFVFCTEDKTILCHFEILMSKTIDKILQLVVL